MAKTVALRHATTGVVKTGFYGFSWTTLFFGFFPALFRGDFITFIGGFVVLLIVGIFTLGIGWFLGAFAWAFLYNKHYTSKLLERGYTLADGPGPNALAAAALGIPYMPQ